MPPPAQAADRGTLRVGLGRDPVSIDPRTVADDEGEAIVRALFEGLVDVAPDGTIVPAGAVSWSLSDDGLTYRFVLRGARFHDGRPVVATDYVRALLSVFDPDEPPFFRDDLLDALRGARVVAPPTDPDAPSATVRGTPQDVLAERGVDIDGGDLILRLRRPEPRFLYELADVALMPVPTRALTEPGRFAREPVGNGPFRMAGPREPGGFIRLTAVTDHHRSPNIDGLLFQIYPADGDRSQRWTELLAGRLHVTAVPTDRRREAVLLFGRAPDTTGGAGLFDHGTAALYAYGLDVRRAPFNDVRLRRALSAAIDRETIARDALGGTVDAATTILPPGSAESTSECAHCRFDPELARTLYEEWAGDQDAGMPPLTLVLSYPRGSGHVTIAERVAADLEETLGIRVRLRVRDALDLRADIDAGLADVFRLALRPTSMGAGFASTLLDPMFRPGAAGNPTGWAGAQPSIVVGLLDQLQREPDPGLAARLEDLILADAPLIPLFRPRHDLLVHPDVSGFHLDPSGRWWPELVSLR